MRGPKNTRKAIARRVGAAAAASGLVFGIVYLVYVANEPSAPRPEWLALSLLAYDIANSDDSVPDEPPPFHSAPVLFCRDDVAPRDPKTLRCLFEDRVRDRVRSAAEARFAVIVFRKTAFHDHAPPGFRDLNPSESGRFVAVAVDLRSHKRIAEMSLGETKESSPQFPGGWNPSTVVADTGEAVLGWLRTGGVSVRN